MVFQCLICHQWPLEMVSTSCGHIYCKPCADRARGTNYGNAVRRCPYCRQESTLYKAPIGIDDFLQNAVLPCPAACGAQMNPRLFDQHKYEECPEAPEQCPYCAEQIIRKEMSEHQILCGEALADFCPGCRVKMPKRMAAVHDCTALQRQIIQTLLAEGCSPTPSDMEGNVALTVQGENILIKPPNQHYFLSPPNSPATNASIDEVD